jgi:alpha-L-arabinofuranosidase
MNLRRFALIALILIGWTVGIDNFAASEVSLSVEVDKPAHRISPRLYGIFFEDINFGGDGGLNAELVKNGSFEFPRPLMGWAEMGMDGVKGGVIAASETPAFPSNPNFMRIHTDGEVRGASNEGFRGMGVRAGERYRLSMQARESGANTPDLRVKLISPDGQTLAAAELNDIGETWSEQTAVLVPSATSAKARLELALGSPGTIDVDLVSLCPERTWKNRPHGLRSDLVKLLADLKPAFLRFPGGCIVEGSELERRYQWKTTIGDRAERQLLINRWNYEFGHRPTPDYFQSFGLGFYEFFLLAEDIGAEPLPILNCGMACQFNTGELVSVHELQPYIQDALDLVEFANGDATTEWGARRAAMGHPEPFGMKLLGVGNEQWGPQYFDRYEEFARGLKEKHPEIQLVSGSGPFPSDENFRYAWGRLRELKAEIVDEHCYAMPDWFLRSATRYDSYDRGGPKVFMGEYAAQSIDIVSPNNRNNLRCALAEAAFMTGLERNSDVVVMSSYAPLLGHEEAWQWRPNLIWFDNLTAYATPNYYAQQMFALNRGDVVLPVKLVDTRPAEPVSGRIGLATSGAAAEFRDIRVTRNGESLMADDLPGDSNDMSTFQGRWEEDDGRVRQSDRSATARAQFGDFAWKDYTLSARARKLGGRGGLGLIFRNSPGGSYLQWNLSGAENGEHVLEAHVANHSVDDTRIDRKPGSIEANRWYDLKVELNGSRVRCYLDGKLVHDMEVAPANLPRLYATASREDGSGEVIIKVVNPTDETTEVDLTLDGVATVESSAQAIVLDGNPEDENSLDQPDKVAPERQELEVTQPRFRHAFPANSLTVLRLDVKEN